MKTFDSDADVLNAFLPFGTIGDYYRPKILAQKKLSRYAFVRFENKSDADIALANLDGIVINNVKIGVANAKQNSFFTMDTGYITNSEFDAKEPVTTYFDSTMPEEHHIKKREEILKNVDVVYAVRVDDLHPTVT